MYVIKCTVISHVSSTKNKDYYYRDLASAISIREVFMLVIASICCKKILCGHQGWGQVQLTKYSSTPSTPNIYQVQVLVKYSFF